MSETEKDPFRISSLFQKYFNGNCSNDEVQEILAIIESPENDNLLNSVFSAHWHNNGHIRDAAVTPSENLDNLNQILDRLHHRINLYNEEKAKSSSFFGTYFSKTFTLFSRIAAIILLPLLIYTIYISSRGIRTYTADRSAWQTIKTPAGMQTDFLLPDGSHVWLNSNSVFKYPLTFAKDQREVMVTGEAYFDITKDSSHPFLVNAGKINIEVKGTRFNVVNYENELETEVILETGSVRISYLDYNGNKKSSQINPGELATFDNKMNQLSVRETIVSKYTAWKDGMLIFRDDQMDEVVRKLNRWFNVEIILQSPELKEYVYTATYRDETLPQILELLKISAPIQYSISDRKRLPDNSYSKRKIIITRKKQGCLWKK